MNFTVGEIFCLSLSIFGSVSESDNLNPLDSSIFFTNFSEFFSVWCLILVALTITMDYLYGLSYSPPYGPPDGTPIETRWIMGLENQKKTWSIGKKHWRLKVFYKTVKRKLVFENVSMYLLLRIRYTFLKQGYKHPHVLPVPFITSKSPTHTHPNTHTHIHTSE